MNADDVQVVNEPFDRASGLGVMVGRRPMHTAIIGLGETAFEDVGRGAEPLDVRRPGEVAPPTGRIGPTAEAPDAVDSMRGRPIRVGLRWKRPSWKGSNRTDFGKGTTMDAAGRRNPHAFGGGESDRHGYEIRANHLELRS